MADRTFNYDFTKESLFFIQKYHFPIVLSGITFLIDLLWFHNFHISIFFTEPVDGENRVKLEYNDIKQSGNVDKPSENKVVAQVFKAHDVDENPESRVQRKACENFLLLVLVIG